ncbi:MAG: pesticidal protein Cry7Aa [Candidatus Falkowbacteria bacterium]
MLNVKRHGIILKPTSRSFEAKSVFNPGVWQSGNTVHMLYRAVDGNFVSSLGYARLEGPLQVAERLSDALYKPETAWESQGLEDPRIVKIDGQFLVTYVAHDGKNAVSCYLYGTDLKKLKRGGLISPKIPYRHLPRIWRWCQLKDEYFLFQAFYQNFGGDNILLWHKDFVPFSEKINGRYYFLERILPDMQLVACDSLDDLHDKYFWIRHLLETDRHVLFENTMSFEPRNIGGGAPPIKTAEGWLVIYHGVEEHNKARTYSAGAALLDLNDPHKIIGRLPMPLLKPETDYELTGQVNNVIFPTGTALFGDELYFYYGCADNCIAAASVSLSALLTELKHNPPKL